MSKHRAEVHPRWGRIAVTLVTCAVLVVAFVAGVLRAAERSARADDTATRLTHAAAKIAAHATSSTAATPTPSPVSTPAPAPTQPPTQTPAPSPTTTPPATPITTPAPSAPSAAPTEFARTDTALPPDSGEGRRAVFSIGRQRVWIVDADDSVERTYLGSGSLTDNLHPGTYAVYSRSANAIGVDDSGTMKWFVRFTHGPNAAIGFHDIPVKDGRPVQTLAQLGTPQSDGCIRQKESDALAMWAFAQLGTKVVVTA